MSNIRQGGSLFESNGLLAQLESLNVVDEGEAPRAENEETPDLALTIRLLAERIAWIVANRLAEDLLSLPTQEDSAGRSRKGE